MSLKRDLTTAGASLRGYPILGFVLFISAMIVLQYVAVSNYAFGGLSDDGGNGGWTSLLPMRGAPGRVLAKVQPILLQPFKAVLDRELGNRATPPDTILGRWVGSVKTVNDVRVWHAEFALVNSLPWCAVGWIAVVAFRRWYRDGRGNPERRASGA